MSDIQRTADYYAGRIASVAVSVDDGKLGELIADADEDSPGELTWEQQGDLHEAITLAIEDEVRHVASEELAAALEEVR